MTLGRGSGETGLQQGIWGQGQDACPVPQQRLPCLATTSRPQTTEPASAQEPYLIKVQNSKEVPGILLGDPGSFLRRHTAVACQAVTQKDLGIGQFMEFSLL